MKTYTGIIDGGFDGLIATFNSEHGLHVSNPRCARSVAAQTDAVSKPARKSIRRIMNGKVYKPGQEP